MTLVKPGLDKGYHWKYKSTEVVGFSMAGVTNTLTLPAYGVSIDVGQGLPFHMGCRDFFVTHGHMDHAHGLPYIIGQKSMMNHPRPRVYFPESEVGKLERVLKAWSELEDHTYDFELHGVREGQVFEIKPQTVVKPFATTHRVPSVGYCLSETRKKLKSKYAGRSREELLKLKSQGTELEELIEHPLFAYTGDTSSEFVKSAPGWLLKTQVLALDVTFWDERKGIDQAHRWGHFHVKELPLMLEAFQGEKLLIVHISSRHTMDFAKETLGKILSSADRARVEIFPRPY